MTVAAGATIDATDITTLQGYTTGKPLVRLVQQVAQSLADNTAAAITFGAGSEDIDTHGFHDTATNTSRVTPTIAGYYRVTALLWIAGATTTTDMFVGVYKNGGIHTLNRAKPDTGSATDAPSVQVTAILTLNGSSDYVEMFGQQDDSGGAARNTLIGSGASSVLEVEFLRPL